MVFSLAAAASAWRQRQLGTLSVKASRGPRDSGFAHGAQGGRGRPARSGGRRDGRRGSASFTVAAWRGDADEVARRLGEGVDVDTRNGKGSTAIHLALQQRHARLAQLLLDNQADVNAVSNKGVTPLMVAATCCSEMLKPLLDRGADPMVFNMRKQRALDLAVEMGHMAAAELLTNAMGASGFEPAARPRDEKASGGAPAPSENSAGAGAIASSAAAEGDGAAVCDADRRCPECGEPVSLGKLRRLAARVAAGEETNRHLLAFASSAAFDDLMRDPRHHRAVANTRLRKEVTETWAVLDAVESVLQGAGLVAGPGNGAGSAAGEVVFVDLCCGKSLTATLLSLRYPESTVVAVDRVPPGIVPHFHPPARYLRSDVQATDFGERLASALPRGRPVVVCGMHLCGALSPGTVELASSLPGVVGLVLSPCCLPSSKVYDNAAHSGSRDQGAQYKHWCDALARYAALHGFETARCYADEHIMSTKNRVVVGCRPWLGGDGALTFASKGAAVTSDHPLAELTATARGIATAAQTARNAMIKRRTANAAKRERWDAEHRKR